MNAVSSAEGRTVDAFLGGLVEAVQPSAGHHRSGLEAVLLAASLPADASGLAIDLGAGAGVAGLCAAVRCPDLTVTLVERDRVVADCARAALERPANRSFAGRVRVAETNISRREGLDNAAADHAIFNPPFRDAAGGTVSPASARAGAHVLDESGLDPWFRAAAALLKPGGTVTVIFRADGLDLLLAPAKGRFGNLDLLPIQPRDGEPAHRLLMRGVKGSRAPMRLLPPLVLHGSGNGFRPEVEAILRDGADLASAAPSWHCSADAPS
jgi:tRNA1(Val) A37 N6-methylase TrmN6